MRMPRSSRSSRWLAGLAAIIGSSAVLVPGVRAAADTVLPVPTSATTFPAPLSGAAGDPCGLQQPYGYIGADDITFKAVLNGPAGEPLNAEFYIVPGDGSAPLDYTAPGASGLTALVVVPRTSFTDGVTYTWRVRETDGTGDFSGWTADCHFISDQTAPPAPTVSSAVFNPANVPVARTPGTFTFSISGPDAADAVGFTYALDTQLSAGGQFPGYGNPFVPVGSDGTATTPTLIPTEPGPNFITVQTVDHAGNVSQPTQYDFDLGYPPPDSRSDLNGDGTPDLVAASSNGHLYVYANDGSGQTFTRATYPDSQTGWAAS